jgi:drug/metabolite transporter (DMT)-like permease
MPAMVGYVLVALAAVGWGTWPLFLHDAVMPASLQAAVVMTIATTLSLPVMFRDRVRVRALPRQWLALAWLGVSDALNVGLFFAAYQRTSVAIAVLTHYFTPVFVALSAPLVLGERLKAKTLGAVVVSVLGLVLLLRPWSGELRPTDLVGAALGAGSAVFYASNVLVNKRLAGVFSSSEVMFYHGLVAIPLMWMMVPSGALASVSRASWVMVVLGSVGPGFLGNLIFVIGLRRVLASHASVLTLLEPFVAVVIAAVFWRQGLGVGQILGGTLILAGAAFVVAQRAHPSPQSSTMAQS